MATRCEQMTHYFWLQRTSAETLSQPVCFWQKLLAVPWPNQKQFGAGLCWEFHHSINITWKKPSPMIPKALNVGKHVVYEAFPIKIFVFFKIPVVRVPRVKKIPAPLWMSHSKGSLAVCHWALMLSWVFLSSFTFYQLIRGGVIVKISFIF